MRRQLLAAGAAVTTIALAGWLLLAPDILVRYPDDLDQTLSYRGVVSVTGDGAVEDTDQPMTVTRHIWVAKSTFTAATIRENVTTTIGDDVRTQANGYVIDRRSMKIRTRSGNFAFTTANAVDRENSYGPNLPMNLDRSGKYRVWSDDTGTAYNLVGTGESYEVDGLRLAKLEASVAPRAVTSAYRDFLDLPETTTLRELAGVVDIDVQRVLDALEPVITPVALSEVIYATTAPVPLRYFLQSTGEVGVEPRTGGIVDVHNVAHRLSVTADLTPLRLRSILGAYSQDPVVRTVLDQVDGLASRPPHLVMSMRYAQTPESVRAAAAVAAGLRSDARRVTFGVPVGLAALALLLAVGALVPPRRQAVRLHLLHRHADRERDAA